ncbi:MAG: hypothetical protein JWR07_3756 [Nevskia sp.]|nr:hypothetical protein [Nevskia sp.]
MSGKFLSYAVLALLLSACGHAKAPPGASADAPPADASVNDMAPAQAAAAPPSITANGGAGMTSFDGQFPKSSPALQAKKTQPGVHYHNGKLVEDNSPPVIEIVSEFQEPSHDKLMVPAYPGDLVYMSLQVETEGQTPLKNVSVAIRSQKGNRYLLMADHTDKDGYLEFHMLAGPIGKDVVTVSALGVERDFILDVTTPSTNEWLGGLDLKGVTSWDLLMSADVKMERDQVEAHFPFMVQALKDKTIRLAGFMMPLGINEKQTHFLLSAVPPSCFFHPPGGPSSAVEVHADKGIEMGYDPIVVEGRFELVERSEGGILYQLREAHVVTKG